MPAWRVNATGDRFAPHAAETGGRAMSVHVTRRAFLLGGAVAASSLAPARQARGQAKATITYWNRSEEHTSELQSRFDLVCRLLLEKKNSDEIYETHWTIIIKSDGFLDV